MVGPTRSFNDLPDDDFAEASNTAQTLVVVLDCLYMAWMGK